MHSSPKSISLSPADRAALETLARRNDDVGLHARIALGAAGGGSVSRIARECRAARETVRKWTRRFAAEGVSGLYARKLRIGVDESGAPLARIVPVAVPQALLRTPPDERAPPPGARLRIECAVRHAAACGIAPPGAALPSRAWFAGRFKASCAAVNAAFSALKAQGFVEAHGRQGTRLAARPPFEGRFLLLLEERNADGTSGFCDNLEPAALEDCVGGEHVFQATCDTRQVEIGVSNVEMSPRMSDVACRVSQRRAREISLAPFMPGVFRAKGAGSLVGFEVPVEPEEAAQIERDYAFLATLGEDQRGGGLPSATTDAARSGDRAPLEAAVEVRQGAGGKYFAPAGALGRRDGRWTVADLFGPMREAHEAGDLHALRALVSDFRTNHRWWFEAFGWPEDLCVRRKVGRAPLVDFLRQGKRTEMWLPETNGLFTADFSQVFPQCKKDFVCAPQGVPMRIDRHGQPGGLVQLEVLALFGGGYGDIRVEDLNGKLIGVVNASSSADCSQISNVHKSQLFTNETNAHLDLPVANCEQLSQLPIVNNATSPRLETRVLSAPLKRPFHDNRIRLVGTGERGLAIYEVNFKGLPPRPIDRWQVIGPFDKGGGEKDKESYLKVFPPEIEPFDANAEYIGMGGEAVRWKSVALGEGERVLDMLAAAPHEISKMNGVAYLRAVVKSPSRRPTMLRYCNDYYGAIWLNGKQVVPAMRGPSQQYGAVEVWLQKGENVILVKTSPGSAGTWHFGAAVNDCGKLDFQ